MELDAAFRGWNGQLNALAYAAENLFHFAIIFLVTILAYTVMGQIIFGRDLEEYSSLTQSFHTNFFGAVNSFDLFEFQEISPLWGLVFYYSNTFLVFFTMINFFLAIVMEAYDGTLGPPLFPLPLQLFHPARAFGRGQQRGVGGDERSL